MINYGNLKLYKELFGVIRPEIFLSHYDLPHRFFHTQEHLDRNADIMSMWGADERYLIANLFHDIRYDPYRQDNEERSAAFFEHNSREHPSKKVISDLILRTKDHYDTNPLNNADMYDIRTLTEDDKIREIEKNIFKEYQVHSIESFIKGRTDFLREHASKEYFTKATSMFHYSVGVYPGSFDPIHIGHQSVIEKAEQIFDKVIIAVGTNPEKAPSSSTVSQYFPFHEVCSYEGLLTDFVKRLEVQNPHASFTVIRGLRNGADLSYETNQLEFMHKMKPDLKMVFIPCDKSREHISSTSIRNLRRFSEEEAEKYLVKKYRYDA